MNQGPDTPPGWSFKEGPSGPCIVLSGSWTVRAFISAPPPALPSIPSSATSVPLYGADIESLDTAGAYVIVNRWAERFGDPSALNFSDFEESHQRILNLVARRSTEAVIPGLGRKSPLAIRFADSILSAGQSIASQLSFLGESAWTVGAVALHPRRFRIGDFVIQLERTAVLAAPIVMLLNFLIGLVVAYLFASQALKFGATIFVVDAVGIGMTRELAPVLTAILVAGRSGSAFAAQLGAMKIAQEVDAIRVLGLSPTVVLVLPRIAALIVALPLLTFVGDVAGVLGGLVIADTTLNIPSPTFFNRLQSVLSLRHVYIGFAKAPFFAIVIGLISCRLGLTVENNARSVGINTTATVVQSIVAVILIDAACAVALQQIGW